ncbi:hypothetical protein Q3G72_031906 [Acer saccharum]|nr:hypothetical protein Q3G72_031906 [Acer saccharum]
MENQRHHRFQHFHKMICAVISILLFLLVINKEAMEAAAEVLHVYGVVKLTGSALVSPAVDFGWHNPGYIHTAVMTGLDPSSIFSNRYGRHLLMPLPNTSFGYHHPFLFNTDHTNMQPGLLLVTKAMADEVENGNVDSIFHIKDISYATGLVEWDFFLHLITPVASRLSLT